MTTYKITQVFLDDNEAILLAQALAGQLRGFLDVYDASEKQEDIKTMRKAADKIQLHDSLMYKIRAKLRIEQGATTAAKFEQTYKDHTDMRQIEKK